MPQTRQRLFSDFLILCSRTFVPNILWMILYCSQIIWLSEIVLKHIECICCHSLESKLTCSCCSHFLYVIDYLSFFVLKHHRSLYILFLICILGIEWPAIRVFLVLNFDYWCSVFLLNYLFLIAAYNNQESGG